MDGWIVADIHPSINFTQGKLKPRWFCEFAYHVASSRRMVSQPRYLHLLPCDQVATALENVTD